MMTRGIVLQVPVLALILALTLTSACTRTTSTRTPEATATAWFDAVRSNDWKAAYNLLSSDLQAQVSPAEFQADWQRMQEHRPAYLAANESAAPFAVQLRAAVEVDGQRTTWTEVAGRWSEDPTDPAPASASPALALLRFSEGLEAAGRVGTAPCQSTAGCAPIFQGAFALAAEIRALLLRPEATPLNSEAIGQEEIVVQVAGLASVTVARVATGWRVQQVGAPLQPATASPSCDDAVPPTCGAPPNTVK